MQKVKNHLKTTRDKVRDVFDDLQQHVQKRRQEIEIQCQTKENDIMTSLAEHDRLRASLTSHAGNAEDLASSAPDDVLLLMVQHMTPKMDELESRSPTPVGSEVLWDVTVDAEMLSRIRSDLSTLGTLVSCFVAWRPGNMQSVSQRRPGNMQSVSQRRPGNMQSVSQRRPGNMQSVSQRRICSDSCTNCHTEIEVTGHNY